MTGKELFSKITNTEISLINISEKNLEMLSKISDNFDDFQLQDYFYQIKKDENGEGLAFEMMMFDKLNIIDFVINEKDIIFSTVKIKEIKDITLNISKLDENNGENIVKLELTYFLGKTLYYYTDIKRLNDIVRIQKKLSNFI